MAAPLEKLRVSAAADIIETLRPFEPDLRSVTRAEMIEWITAQDFRIEVLPADTP